MLTDQLDDSQPPKFFGKEGKPRGTFLLDKDSPAAEETTKKKGKKQARTSILPDNPPVVTIVHQNVS